MSAKWRDFSIKMSSNWIFNVTFVYQFLICDHLKKNACQYIYFKNSLYISQSDDMSAKWRHYDTFMSVFLFENITFLFQFFIYDILKETACKYLTFNFFLYIKGFWRIFWRHWRNWRNHLWMPKSKSIDYPYAWELSLGYLLSPKNLFFS